MDIEKFNALKDKFLKEMEIENTKDLDYYQAKLTSINTLGGKCINLMFSLGREYAELSLHVDRERSKVYEKIKWEGKRTYTDKDALSKCLENDDLYNLEVKKAVLEEQIKVMENIKKCVSDMNFQLKNIITIVQMKMGYLR